VITTGPGGGQPQRFFDGVRGMPASGDLAKRLRAQRARGLRRGENQLGGQRK
jgi:hypothetical protein